MNQTKIQKGRDGFEADTNVMIPELGADRAIKIRTSKSSRGGISSSATVVKLGESGGFASYSFIMFHDFSKTVATEPSRCTEKSITTLHTKVLADIAMIRAGALAHYAAKGEYTPELEAA